LFSIINRFQCPPPAPCPACVQQVCPPPPVAYCPQVQPVYVAACTGSSCAQASPCTGSGGGYAAGGGGGPYPAGGGAPPYSVGGGAPPYSLGGAGGGPYPAGGGAAPYSAGGGGGPYPEGGGGGISSAGTLSDIPPPPSRSSQEPGAPSASASDTEGSVDDLPSSNSIAASLTKQRSEVQCDQPALKIKYIMLRAKKRQGFGAQDILEEVEEVDHPLPVEATAAPEAKIGEDNEGTEYDDDRRKSYGNYNLQTFRRRTTIDGRQVQQQTSTEHHYGGRKSYGNYNLQTFRRRTTIDGRQVQQQTSTEHHYGVSRYGCFQNIVREDAVASKRAIHDTAIKIYPDFTVDVICSSTGFTYLVSTTEHCEAQKDNVICFVYKRPLLR
ncbi:ground-like domain protein, partial [Cooperia oncophora]